MKNALLAFFLISLSCCCEISAQPFIFPNPGECATPDLNVPASIPATCSDYNNYYPDPTNNYENTPVLTFKINFHLFRRSDGTGVIQPSDLPFFNSMFANLNFLYANIQPPTIPVSPPAQFIADSRIQFELTGIYFHDDDDYYETSVLCGPEYRDAFGIDLDHVVNVFFYQAPSQSASCGPQIYVNMTNVDPAQAISNPNYLGAQSGLLAHEIGHAIGGLNHTWMDQFTDTFFPDNNQNWLSCNSTNITNNIMGYNHCRNYLSPMQMGYWHYRACNAITTKYLTFCDYNSTNTRTVSVTQTWNRSQVIGGDLIIPAGVTLTVKCNVSLPMGGRVIVQRGGKLIIDGGRFTNFCGGFWRGIEVWGNPTQPQGNVSSNGQGQVYVINGGIIENAEIGIAATHYDPTGLPDLNYGGGIIRANNGIFRNNITGVQIWGYVSPVTANFSNFTTCTFETDASWPDNSVYPSAFVDLREVTGFVTMRGCSFRNTAPGNFPVGNRGTGVFGVDAMFRVWAYCPTVQCTSPVTSAFENLTYGVNAASSIGFLTCNVDRATFATCDKGVSLRGIDWVSTTRCDFTVPPGTPNDSHFGIYLDDCDGFSVQENTITGTGFPGYNVGIVIKDSRDRSNIVYNNTLDNLHVGLEALGDNDGPNFEDGLRFNCNDMTNNLYDVFVTNATNQNLITTDIGRIQGKLDLSNPSPKQLVRNTYSASCVANNENQYRATKSSPNPIIHEHHIDAFTLPQCRDGLVLPAQRNYSFNKPSDCPSSFSTPTNQSTLRVQLITYANEIAQQQALLDAGNSPYLFNTIATSSPGTVKSELLAVGPYLSDDVLLAAINSGLPTGILKEILIPNSPLSGSVMSVLNQQNLPNGFYEEINAVQSGISEREKVETHIQQLRFERDILLSERIRLLLNDSNIVNPFDSVVASIKYEQIPDQKCRLASAYVAMEDYVRADSTLDVIEAEQQQPALDNFCQLLRILIELHQSVTGCLAMRTDSVTTAEVTAIATDPNEKGCVQAQALLMKVFLYFYQEDVVFPENEISLREIQSPGNSKSNPDFKAYPNPASDRLIVEYKISPLTSNTHLILIDITGKEVLRQNISPAEKNVSIDISSLSIGLYFWRIESDAEIIFTDKFSVIR